jgi:hypothetical protein
MVKLNTAAPLVPELFTITELPGAPVVTVPTAIVAAAPVEPVDPVEPRAPETLIVHAENVPEPTPNETETVMLLLDMAVIVPSMYIVGDAVTAMRTVCPIARAW